MKKLQRPLGVLALLALFTAFVLWVQEPPAPVPASAPVETFSAERAMVHVAQIAQAPHPPGTAEHDRVRDYLVAELGKLGFQTTVQKRLAWRDEREGALRVASVENIVAERTGTAPTGVLMLTSHYDSHLSGPGAGDAASGVAAILEAMRALGNAPHKNTLRVLITDAEEFGLLGAQGYADSLKEKNDAAPTLVLNFEARGGGGPVFMFETSDKNQGLMEVFAKSCPHPHASSLMYALYKTLPNDTDLTVFKKAGMSGLNFAFVGRWQSYHSALDTPENLDPRSLQQHGDSALTLSRAFLETDLKALSDPPRQDAIYFDILGKAVLTYPMVLGAVFAGGACVLFLVLLWRHRKEEAGALAFFTGLGMGLATLVTGGVIATLIGLAVGPFRLGAPNRDPYGVRWFEAALLLSVLAFVWLEWGPMVRRFAGKLLPLGALFWWLAALIATVALLPGASYLFCWPLLFALIGVALEKPWVGAVVTLLLFAPVWHSLTLLLGFGMPPLLGVLAAFGLLPLVGLVRQSARPLLLLCPLVLFLAALLCYLAGALHRGPRTSSLAYILDTGKSQAQWVSLHPPSAWTQSVLGAAPTKTTLQELPAFSAPAPTRALPIPQLVRTDTRLTVTLPERATELSLHFPAALAVTIGERRLPATANLRWFGPPQELAVTLPKAATITVEAVFPGLPASAPPRPAGWIPSALDSATDVRIVRSTVP